MTILHRRFAVLIAAASLILCLSARAQNDKSTARNESADKSSDKSAEKPTEAATTPDSTTQGTIDVGGQHIGYTAIAGTITVGATDSEDAQLDPDGKPLPGSQLALAPPKDPADAAPLAHMFYVAYFKTGAKAE